MTTSVIRIILVDDHAVVRAGYRRLLEQHPGIQVVAEADGGERAYQLFVEHKPDVVVLDLSMPKISGFETIQRLVSHDPDACILVFSMHEDALLAERAVRLGARGYITKTAAPEILAAAVEQVAAGRLYLSADIATAIASLKLTGGENPFQLLSAREFEIFSLIIAGTPLAEIAQSLKLSSKTVANYHTLIKNKLGAPSDIDLVLLAHRHHLV